MSVTVVALLGLTLAQSPAPDYYTFRSRSLTLPIEYKAGNDKRNIRHVELYASSDKGQTWAAVATVYPNQDKFVYVAPKDGLYWFHIVIVDLQGRKDPQNLTTEPPAMKVLVDTIPPVVTITNARRNGEEACVEWRIDDEFHNDVATRVSFRPAGGRPEEWWEVSLQKLPPGARNGVKFPTGTTGPLLVRVIAKDFAGNTAEAIKEIPAPGVGNQTVANASQSALNSPPPPSSVIPPPESLTPTSDLGTFPPAAPSVGLSGGAVAGTINPGPASPLLITPAAPAVTPPTVASTPQTSPAPTPTVVATAPVAPSVTQPAPLPVFPTVVNPPAPSAVTGSQPVATFDPHAYPPQVANSTPPPAVAGPQALQTFDPRQPVTTAGAGFPMTPTSTTPGGVVNEISRAEIVNSFKFDLNYQVDQRGPSGIKCVDVWVTRDNGQTWALRGKHTGQEGVVKVDLSAAGQPQPEGLYGFRLIPVSGAGISEPAPVSGDVPDLQVEIDVTPPMVQILPPTSDPANPAALVIHWEAADKHLGDQPITLDWSESPTGPWRPIALGGEVVQGPATVPGAARLANSGSYSWQVPPGVPARIHLKVTARDAAGNITEKVTREPMLIDLMKPRARIIGIRGNSVVRP